MLESEELTIELESSELEDFLCEKLLKISISKNFEFGLLDVCLDLSRLLEGGETGLAIDTSLLQ